MTTTATRTPAGARLTVKSWGRDFKVLDVDRWPIGDWPETVAPELVRLGAHLAFLAVWRRRSGPGAFVSGFTTGGTLYAPTAAVDDLLAVLLSAETGDPTQVTLAADLAAQAVATVVAAKGKAARSAAATTALAWFADELADQRSSVAVADEACA